MTDTSLAPFLLFSHLISKYVASQQCFQSGGMGEDRVTSLMRTTALHRSTRQLSLGKATAPQVQELIRNWEPGGAASCRVKCC